MDEMWARAVVPDCLRSFVGSRSMCRRGAAVPDRLVVLQACAQRDSKCAYLGGPGSNLYLHQTQAAPGGVAELELDAQKACV